jgi:hypothetical protein
MHKINFKKIYDIRYYYIQKNNIIKYISTNCSEFSIIKNSVRDDVKDEEIIEKKINRVFKIY